MTNKYIKLLLLIIGLYPKMLDAKELPNVIYPNISTELQDYSLSVSEKNDYKQAWILLERGEKDKAYEVVNKYSESKAHRKGWSIVLSAIYYGQGKYGDALLALQDIRIELEKAYRLLGTRDVQLTKAEQDSLQYHYYKMLLISGSSNFKLEKWTMALHDLLEYTKYNNDDIFVDDYIALAYHKNKDYDNALLYFKRSYNGYQDGDLKDTAAYNIGAIYALLANVTEAINWLIA